MKPVENDVYAIPSHLEPEKLTANATLHTRIRIFSKKRKRRKE